jgi:flagellar biosynthesis/type III secretory pathway M-ring protein FliF/YscJ
MLKARFGGRRGSMSTAFVVLAVGTGVVVIAIVIAVVLVVLLVTLSMRDREKRAAEERGEVRREVAQAEDRAGRAERDRNVVRERTERTDKMGPDR